MDRVRMIGVVNAPLACVSDELLRQPMPACLHAMCFGVAGVHPSGGVPLLSLPGTSPQVFSQTIQPWVRNHLHHTGLLRAHQAKMRAPILLTDRNKAAMNLVIICCVSSRVDHLRTPAEPTCTRYYIAHVH